MTRVPRDGDGYDLSETAADRERGADGSLGRPASPIRNHAHVTRGLGHVPESVLPSGLFGRMFPRLDPYVPDSARIDAIATRMAEHSDSESDGRIPAGYTYLGQFVAHDLTFDPSSSLQRQHDPDALVNFRTPRFDLDSLYGRGPVDQPYLYERMPAAGPPTFVVATTRSGARGELDLPRDPRGVAIIGDPRNDENVILSQLQLTFMLFHNSVCDWLGAEGGTEHARHRKASEDVFDCAQRLVRWHYQWIVLHDFLKRIADAVTYKDVLRQEPLVPQGDPVEQVRLRFFAWRHQIFMPVEFAVAAYRFGHSQVRPAYRLNAAVGPLPVLSRRPSIGHRREIKHLGGFRRLPVGWQIDWARFFHLDDSDRLQYARRIDRNLATPLLALPPELAGGELTDLARRDLTRGALLGLPSGQAVALAMGVEPLDDEDLDLPGGGLAPLWYYVLREAELHDAGRTLGTVGSRIVAEVFAGAIAADPSSYLSNAPGWQPVLPSARPGQFTMADLIRFTGFGA